MEKTRLKTFSDGVIAIIITIMVLELKVPHGPDMLSLKPLLPVFLSYVMSFLYVGIYWNNHHHMLQTVKKVKGGILWANLHLLFWLSLVPFVTSRLGENHISSLPVALYGLVLLMAALAYWVLQHLIMVSQGADSTLAKAVTRDIKDKLSLVLYAIAIAMLFYVPWASIGIYVSVALMWIVPVRRIEQMLID